MSTSAAVQTPSSPSAATSAPTGEVQTTASGVLTGAPAAAASSTNLSSVPNAPSADWTAGFDDDAKGYIGNKGFKAPKDVLDSYRGLEKLLGAPKDRLLTLPERMYDDQGKLNAEGRALRERLGAPKDAKEYDLKAPKESLDPQMMEHFRGVFHELGIPKTDAEMLTSSWNQYVEKMQASQKEAAVQAFKDGDTQIKKEWGAAYDQNLTKAREAVKLMGLTEKQINAFTDSVGYVDSMKFFQKLGTQVGEAPYIGGSKPDAILEPVNARAQIKELINDKGFAKLLQGGDKDAAAKWERLHQQAFPGEYKS